MYVIISLYIHVYEVLKRYESLLETYISEKLVLVVGCVELYMPVYENVRRPLYTVYHSVMFDMTQD